VRTVLDPNVIISGLLSRAGRPAQILRAWDEGQFELVVSRKLLDELVRALSYPKLRRHISEEDAKAVIGWITASATTAADPGSEPPVRSEDPGDDYLVALAWAERAVLVSGDTHLLDLASEIPVYSPRRFLALLAEDS
jgi:putative PIN family toxin of toxin-antitoxin system